MQILLWRDRKAAKNVDDNPEVVPVTPVQAEEARMKAGSETTDEIVEVPGVKV